jgi:uncharacterized protein (UPF0264 family)
MQLLVSVASAADASEAMAGGADIIDTKDPSAGPLGPVTLGVFHDVRRLCAGRLVSAALGDPADTAEAKRRAAAFASAGAGLVKVGFGQTRSAGQIAALLTAALTGTRARAGDGTRPATRVIAVCYVDAPAAGVSPQQMLSVAKGCGASGVLLDTADKAGPGLCALMSRAAVREWLAAAAGAGLLSALAGRLTIDDVGALAELPVEVVGIRGAACEAGRLGRVSAERVRALRRAGAEAPAHARGIHDNQACSRWNDLRL